MSFIPSNQQSVSHSKSSGMIRGKIIKIVHTPCQSCVDMSNDFTFKFLFRIECFEGEVFPESACFGGDTGGDDFDFFFSVACWSTCMVTGTGRNAWLGNVGDAHFVRVMFKMLMTKWVNWWASGKIEGIEEGAEWSEWSGWWSTGEDCLCLAVCLADGESVSVRALRDGDVDPRYAIQSPRRSTDGDSAAI